MDGLDPFDNATHKREREIIIYYHLKDKCAVK